MLLYFLDMHCGFGEDNVYLRGLDRLERGNVSAHMLPDAFSVLQ